TSMGSHYISDRGTCRTQRLLSVRFMSQVLEDLVPLCQAALEAVQPERRVTHRPAAHRCSPRRVWRFMLKSPGKVKRLLAPFSTEAADPLPRLGLTRGKLPVQPAPLPNFPSDSPRRPDSRLPGPPRFRRMRRGRGRHRFLAGVLALADEA